VVGEFQSACARVVHQALPRFISYIDWELYWAGLDVDYFTIRLVGANDDEPFEIIPSSIAGRYSGLSGLHEAGPKRIASVVGHLSDGSVIDLTEDLIDYFGLDTLIVRFPQVDTFGSCP